MKRPKANAITAAENMFVFYICKYRKKVPMHVLKTGKGGREG